MSGKFRIFSRVGKTAIIPLRMKILIIFLSLIILSNFATNFISVQLTQKEIINLNNTIMVQQLKELFNNAASQFQIFAYSGDRESCNESMRNVAASGFGNPNSIAVGVNDDGRIFFMASRNPESDWDAFPDSDALSRLNAQKSLGIEEGSVTFVVDETEYFGVYKFQDDWNYYIIRAERRSDLDEKNYRIYGYISILIASLTIMFIVIGYFILRKEFHLLSKITGELIAMQAKKQLRLIDLTGAPNDDVTYLAASFNSLSSQMNSLLGTFQKFVSKDIVAKAYKGLDVGLEGSQQELTMLFSDVKSFTYRTETLGNDIIEVLNVHYNRVIQNVHDSHGIVGSIIGDAILAVYGTLGAEKSKSYNAIVSAWSITRSTAELRAEMLGRRQQIEATRALTESEERVFQAVLVDVGVGIDGGNVFYGTIGRNDSQDPLQAHMANTVIGDTVNSASRLEGLTRIYHIPVVVSEYVKDEVERESSRYRFFEVDTVQVKGKTQGKKIYFPFDTETMDSELIGKYERFEEGLAAYYSGEWPSARKIFKETGLDVTQVFLERMGNRSVPDNWSGIWAMTTK